MRRIFKEGLRYKRAGVLLTGLSPQEQVQLNLFNRAHYDGRQKALMATLDRINERFGRGTVRLGAEGLQQAWAMKQDRRSPRYTTRWDEVPVVHADARPG